MSTSSDRNPANLAMSIQSRGWVSPHLSTWFGGSVVDGIWKKDDNKSSPDPKLGSECMSKQARTWVVEFDSGAVVDFEDVKSRGDRKAVFNVVQKLADLGPDLPSPHMKSLKGEADLFELRPKQGACEARPIYARLGRRFVVLAVAAKKKDFERAVADAGQRLDQRR